MRDREKYFSLKCYKNSYLNENNQALDLAVN